MDRIGNGGRASAGTPARPRWQLGDLNGRVPGRRDTGQAAHRQRHRRHRGGDDARARDNTWPARALGGAVKQTGRDHVHLAATSRGRKIRFPRHPGAAAQIISSPTWSGLEGGKVSYNAGYTNVHELIPWRTLTGRQQFYWTTLDATSAKSFVSYRRPCTSRRCTRSRASQRQPRSR